MCLYSIKKDPHVLKRDRLCWKICCRDEIGTLFSVVHKKEYKLGKLYVEECKPQVDVLENFYGKFLYVVSGGYMHAFSSIKKAKSEYEHYSYTKNWSPVICECTIPARTEVYTDRTNSEICARALRVDRILKL